MCWAFVATEACFLIKDVLILLTDASGVYSVFSRSVPPEWTLVRLSQAVYFQKLGHPGT